MSAKKNIYLIGFMGTGKSATGRVIAEALGYDFVDMDEVIEQRAGKTITAIFAEDGEPAFRAQESALAAELCQREGLVVATGGGIVLDPENTRGFERSGFPVCFQASAGTILRRVAEAEHRPLLEDGEKAERIRALLTQRKALYEAVPHQVDTDSLTVAEQAAEVLKLFQSQQGSS
jgi:shikimate kinase